MSANRLFILGTLRTRSALHIGSGRSSGEADDLLRRNGRGEVIIPGSAIAGPLRTCATRLAPRLGSPVCKALLSPAELEQKNERERDKQKRLTTCSCDVCRLFGALDPREQNEGGAGGWASRITVSDGVLVGQGYTWVRDGVGIERRTGAAARRERVKFDLEVVTAGAGFALQLEVEDPQPEDEWLLAAVLGEWQAGRVALGGRVTRGLGAVALESLRCGRLSLDSEDKLMAYLSTDDVVSLLEWDAAWLANGIQNARQKLRAVTAARLGRTADAPLASGEVQKLLAQGWLELEFTLAADGAFLANDVALSRRTGFDHAPLLEPRPAVGEDSEDALSRPVLPGAGLRGGLRSQAERIARTLATQWAVAAGDDRETHKQHFLAHCPACDPLSRTSAELACCDALLPQVGQETPEADLCLACQLFGSPRRGSRLRVEDAPLAKGTQPVFKSLDLLAIDRFTGGGREGAKFDALALWQPHFAARLYLDNPRGWELGWLALLLRDLAEGRLTLGWGSAKGLGQVHVEQWTARLGFLLPEDLPVSAGLLDAVSCADEELYRILELHGAVHHELDSEHESWHWELASTGDWYAEVQDWVGKFVDKLRTFQRQVDNQLPALLADHYFGTDAEILYPLLQEV